MSAIDLDALLDRHGRDPTRLVQILCDVMAHAQRITPAAITHIAGGLGLPRARVEGVTDSVAVAKDMIDKAGIGLAPGSAFGEEGRGWFRWCFANRPQTNAAGLERLAGYLAGR